MDTTNYAYPLRRLIGILGMSLPFILILGYWGVKPSISDYYYSRMGTVFTSILITFGLILLTYKGSKTVKKKINENIITTIAGALAIIVAIVPTRFGCDPSSFTCDGSAVQYAHNDDIRNYIHLLSAGVFIFLLGLLILLSFAKDKYHQRFYKISGWLVIIGLVFTIYAAFSDKYETGIFWGETFCLFFFGLAWLRRGVRVTK